jgi:polysaccharide export outer membrane protein
MRDFSLRSLLVTVVVLGLSSFGRPFPLEAQRPSPEQVQQLLKNPALIEQLRQRIASSGLSKEQIRARLRAEGYPENLLDSYLSDAAPDATATGPSEDVYAAVRQLGITDSTDLILMRCGIDPDTLSATDPATLPTPAQRTTNAGATTDSIAMRLEARKQQLANRCVAKDQIETLNQTAKQSADSGYTIFGLDFFRRQTTVFNPNVGGPVDANYRFGPGDQLMLILTGDVEQAYTLDVTREGFIVIPQVGRVQVNNLTLAQLETVLYTRLSRVYSGIGRGEGATTQFSISPVRLRSNLIYVTGNVVNPGAYQVSSAGTLLSALYAAGGPSDNGTLRAIEVRRAGALVATFDFYDYLIKGDASNDIRLQNGDVVFVPVHLARARIVGEVVRPATYEIKPTETLADALRFAEGFKASAARNRVQIERIIPPAQRAAGRDRTTIDVALNADGSAEGIALNVHPGDVIRAFPITDRIRNRIVVSGNVNMPGSQGLEPGMKLSDALRRAGLKSDTYLGRVLVSRLLADSTRMQLRAELRDIEGNVVNDFELQEDDEIRVFSRTEFRPTRYVAINGAVQRSGQYPYREGMTLRDLVLLAGGLHQSAYLNEAKIARLPQDRSGSKTAQEFSVALDSSYLFERGPDGRYFGPPGLPANAGPSEDIVLLPYDNVLILRQPDWELQRTVSISGEVRFPGRYTLLHKNEKITDIVKRAGGLTPEAYANGVIFYRKGSGVGRIGIDLPEVLKDPRNRDNLLLQDQDSIYIPRFSSIITVQGAVNSPLAVSYVPGKDLYYYINAAGGPTAGADLGRAYVVQPNGKVEAITKRFLVPNSVPVPKPGSSIFVPAKDSLSRSIDPITLIGAIGGILSSLVTIVVVLTNR